MTEYIFFSYGRYLEGTGSILRINKNNTLEDRLAENGTIEISRNSVRFFSPNEVANLHCFPSDFGEHIFI